MPIRFEDVHYIYNPKSTFEQEALKGIDLELDEGKFIAIVGKTGCGKSTLISHINALVNPTSGRVVVFDFINAAKKRDRSKKVKNLRKRVGLIFQFPEYQLFEDTLEKDVAFGPKNFGLKKEEAIKKAHEALNKVGLDESFYERSPFDLSGGERRKAAIAGVLASDPDLIVADEPTAGLDPASSREMMSLFKSIHEEGKTIILVTHDMNLVLEYADEMVLMHDGKVVLKDEPSSLFGMNLEEYSLEEPNVFKAIKGLKEKGFEIDPKGIKNVEDLSLAIKRAKK